MKNFFQGTLCGFLNGFFGSGGGVIAVPIFEKDGCSVQEAHASSVALIFMLSLVTAVFYGFSGGLTSVRRGGLFHGEPQARSRGRCFSKK